MALYFFCAKKGDGAYTVREGSVMTLQFDRNALNKLLMLNDKQLELVVRKLATEYGLDLSRLQIDPNNIAELRRALRTADDSTLKALGEQLQNGGLKP